MRRRQPCAEKGAEVSDWRHSVCKEPAAGKSLASLEKYTVPNVSKV